MTKGKLLLTSSGITNDHIQTALVDLLGIQGVLEQGDDGVLVEALLFVARLGRRFGDHSGDRETLAGDVEKRVADSSDERANNVQSGLALPAVICPISNSIRFIIRSWEAGQDRPVQST